MDESWEKRLSASMDRNQIPMSLSRADQEE